MTSSSDYDISDDITCLTGSGPRSEGSRETLLKCTGTFSRGSSCDENRMANTGSVNNGEIKPCTGKAKQTPVI